MNDLLAALAAALPDVPTWVEARGMRCCGVADVRSLGCPKVPAVEAEALQSRAAVILLVHGDARGRH
jgi:hypothetical protein